MDRWSLTICCSSHRVTPASCSAAVMRSWLSFSRETVKTVEVRNLSKSFGKIAAVRDVSFSVSSGSILGVIGRNGAGKTTTIRMVLNIHAPDSGEVRFDGEKATVAHRDRIGYLPEERGLYTKMKVMDLLLFLAELKGFRGSAAVERAEDYLRRFDLLPRARSKVEELSKGNQQKVQFITAVLHDPDLVILDEPFSGLDPVNTNLLIDMMAELKSRGKAIIFSTHIMDFAEKLCDRITLIDSGSVLLNGTMEEIKREHAKRHVNVVGDGDLGFVRSLPYVRATFPFGQSLGVSLQRQEDAQLLLAELVQRRIAIRKFDAIDVTLHDIFVEKTTQNGASVDAQEKAA